MQKIFEEYGGVIVTALAIVALIGVVYLMFAGDGSGWMEEAFENVIDSFLNKTSSAIGGINTPAM